MVARIANRAGLHHGLTAHTLRHLRLTDLARAGMDLHAIAQYGGHRSLETERYDRRSRLTEASAA